MAQVTLNDILTGTDKGKFQKLCDSTCATIRAILKSNGKFLTGKSANKLHIPIVINCNIMEYNPKYNSSTDGLASHSRDSSTNDADTAQFWQLLTGRKEGNTPENFYEILGQWMSRKGVQVPQELLDHSRNEENAKRKFINSIIWKIKKEGTKQYRNNSPILTSQFEAQMNKLKSSIERFVRMWEQTVTQREQSRINQTFR